MFFVIAVLVGVLMGLLIPYNLNASMLSYLAVALIAALDSVLGGLFAYLNKRFNINVFMIGLVSNAILGIVLTFIGNILGISLSFAVIIVFGVRMFNNMAAIRRQTFDRYFERRARERENERRLRLEEVTSDESAESESAENDEAQDAEQTNDVEKPRDSVDKEEK